MCMDARNQLINITTNWLSENMHEISKGLSIRAGKDLLAYERNLMLLVLQLGGMIMEWALKTTVEDWRFHARAKKSLHRKLQNYRNHQKYPVTIRTLFGNHVRVVVHYFVPKRMRKRGRKKRKRGRNGSGIYPALDVLGIRNRATPAFQSEVAREVAEGPSMLSAQERLSRRGIHVGIKVLQRMSESFGETALRWREEWLQGDGKAIEKLSLENESLKGKRVLIGIDGGRIRTRKTKRGRIPSGKKRHGYHTDWREPKVLTIRVLDENGSVSRTTPPIYDGTIGSADEAFLLLKRHLSVREIESASEILCVGDGAPWIWNRMENMLMELGVPMEKVHYGIDFYHAVEHLANATDEIKQWSKRKRKKWLKKARALLRDGKIDAIIEELRALVRGRNGKALKREIKYFEANRERMRYDLLQKKKLPIGSGAVESGIRQVVNMRLKGVGMFWLKKNAEAFLHLNCYLKAGRWEVIERAVIG